MSTPPSKPGASTVRRRRLRSTTMNCPCCSVSVLPGFRTGRGRSVPPDRWLAADWFRPVVGGADGPLPYRWSAPSGYRRRPGKNEISRFRAIGLWGHQKAPTRRPCSGFCRDAPVALMTRFEWSSALISGCSRCPSRSGVKATDGPEFSAQLARIFLAEAAPFASWLRPGRARAGHTWDTARLVWPPVCLVRVLVGTSIGSACVPSGTRSGHARVPCRGRVPVASLLCPITDAGCTDMRRVRGTGDHRINRECEQDKKSSPGRDAVEFRFNV